MPERTIVNLGPNFFEDGEPFSSLVKSWKGESGGFLLLLRLIFKNKNHNKEV